LLLDPENLQIVIGLGAVLFLIVSVLVVLIWKAVTHRGDDEADKQLIELKAHLDGLKDQAERQDRGLREELKTNRQELSDALSKLSETVRRLAAEQAEQQTQFRDKLDEKMQALSSENAQKLEEMRKTVYERLQSTLEKRLNESFKTVSERLEAVHQGLGEMQSLATGVGDLKRVLTNVKSRGMFGEVQLENLIQDFLTPSQYIRNYDCGHATGNARVEFGVRLPGVEQQVYLPVDAKFPTESYERLLSAVETGDVDAMEVAAKELERSIKSFAKDIASKYINPPHTSDFAILFVPTEGLYAEILRREGLHDELQRSYRVTVAGPTNFQALLSSFKLGFRQMALAERAGEVWEVLGAVKTEFEKFGDQIGSMGKNLEAAIKHVEKMDTRKRQMLRALKDVEALPETDSDKLIGTKDSSD